MSDDTGLTIPQPRQNLLKPENRSVANFLPYMAVLYEQTKTRPPEEEAKNGGFYLGVNQEALQLTQPREDLLALVLDFRPHAFELHDGNRSNDSFSEYDDEYERIRQAWLRANKVNDAEAKQQYHFGIEFLLFINHPRFTGPVTYHFRNASAWMADKVMSLCTRQGGFQPTFVRFNTDKVTNKKNISYWAVIIPNTVVHSTFNLQDPSTYPQDFNIPVKEVAQAINNFRNPQQDVPAEEAEDPSQG